MGCGSNGLITNKQNINFYILWFNCCDEVLNFCLRFVLKTLIDWIWEVWRIDVNLLTLPRFLNCARNCGNTPTCSTVKQSTNKRKITKQNKTKEMFRREKKVSSWVGGMVHLWIIAYPNAMNKLFAVKLRCVVNHLHHHLIWTICVLQVDIKKKILKKHKSFGKSLSLALSYRFRSWNRCLWTNKSIDSH